MQFRLLNTNYHKKLPCAIFKWLQEDAKADALDAFYNEIINKELLLNTEYKIGGAEYVSIYFPDTKDDVAKELIAGGYILAENRREKRLAKIVTEYKQAQEKAKSARVSIV